ncbi:MAG TPA: Ig-like domain-containing protein [Geobacterales bacterium]|nr:Ig-like domain-containing protein [Geobacterales bacterium]
MRISKAIGLAIIVATSGLVFISSAQAASECPATGTLSSWGVNSTGYFSVASGGTCLFPIRMEGVVKSSSISQKPAHGTLKRLNISTYEYTAKAGYKGSDSFAVQATGKGPTGLSGTSVITMNATVQ